VTGHGLLLAAGAGRRLGTPKALLVDADGVAFLDRAVRVLLDGGCGGVTVVLGAAEAAARALLEAAGWSRAPGVRVAVAADWQEGMGASLRTGLAAVGDIDADADADAALVSLVDLPDVGAPVVRRVLAAGEGPGALVRATYRGRPGHPVLLGRDHWAGVLATAHGDRGARDYLRAHPPQPCECGDLATGRDVDHPLDLPPGVTSSRDTRQNP
jgi:molybdenum cofactor cytidylyltransferase/nicotine blue oxidoreductase